MTSRQAARSAGKESGVSTGRRRKPHKYPVEKAEELISSRRASMFDAQTLLALLPMRVYHRIADIGCGPGFFTLPLAKFAFDGTIYAVDIQQGMLDIAAKRLEKARLNNVELVLSKETRIPLGDTSLDGALLVNALHEATQPKTLLKEMFRLLRKGGWAGILDWRKVEMDEGPPIEERLERDEAAAVATDVGFRVTSCHDLNRRSYFVLLLK